MFASVAQDLSKVTELDVNAYGQPTSRKPTACSALVKAAFRRWNSDLRTG